MTTIQTLVLSSFTLLALAACNKDDDPVEEDQCINTPTYNIDNGTACNNTPTDPSIFELDTVGATINVTFNFVPPHPVLGILVSNPTTYSITADPQLASEITPVANEAYDGSANGQLGWKFGIAVTGVPFDPVANEPWENTQNGELNYAWNLEVLSSNAGLIYDCNNAHDPNRYHYHGTPISYIQTIEDGVSHSKVLGYAADGFPIYYKYGYEDPEDPNSAIVALVSSYRLKEGCRPGDGISAPDGGYDGSYVNDYEYVEGLGDLDECNGRWSVTPEFPAGTYVYYVTDEFPSIPRCFKGTPSDDFMVP